MADRSAPEQTASDKPLAHWYRRTSTYEVAVDCGGVQHTVRWRRGRLRLLDHDVAAERAVVALGGDPCPCVEVLDVWRRACETASGRAHRRALPEDLRPAAALCRMVAAERRWAHPALRVERRAFADDLVRNLREALVKSLQPSQPTTGYPRRVELDIRAVAAGSPIQLEADVWPSRVRLRIELALSWLVQVDGLGLANVDDLVVLAVVDNDYGAGLVGVLALSWKIPSPQLTVPIVAPYWVGRHGSDGGWCVVRGRRRVRVGDGPWWSISVR